MFLTRFALCSLGRFRIASTYTLNVQSSTESYRTTVIVIPVYAARMDLRGKRSWGCGCWTIPLWAANVRNLSPH